MIEGTLEDDDNEYGQNSDGFIPEDDKLHQMQPQRPGSFIAITEGGRVFEVVAMMETQQVMVRQWEVVPWDQAKVDAETNRVQSELVRIQQQGRQAQPPQPQHPGIIRPGNARPGTI